MAGEAPNRNDSNINFNRRLEELEKTLQETRLKHESDLKAIKMANINFLSNLTKTQQKELEKLDLDLAKKVADYQVSLRDKYVSKYKDDLRGNAELEKRIAKEVQDFIYVEKNKRREADTKEELARQYEIENISKQVELNISNYKNQLRREQAELDLAMSQQVENQKITDAQLAYDIEKKRLDTIQQAALIDIQLENQAHQDALNRISTEYSTKMQHIDDEKKANKRSLQDGTKSFKDYMKDRKKLIEQENQIKQETADAMKAEGASDLDIMKETGKISGGAVKEAIFSKETASAIGNNLLNGLKQMFDSTIQTYGQYQTKVNTRLQGSGSQWQGMVGTGIESKLKYTVGVNPYVKLQQVMDNVVKATEAGIASNVEQRAFLGTISESIAATFDAFDSNLTRIIRLQQADTTAARLGLEAGLTSFFNANFKDNSYLNNAFDTVSQNLIEATTQMTAEEGVAFEYQVQKWLGSLYSLGFSDTALGKISEAIGQLGSGNVSALSSNTEMQNLIVMAASRANMSYSDLLLKGLDSSSTNKLLRSMVEYLSDIAASDNKVVKSEYARIFGMTVSDLKAVTNLEGDLDMISKSAMSYGGAVNELYSQMNQLPSRVSIAGMMQNLFDNVNYSIGTGIAANPVTYALWQITSMIEDLTGGIALPTFSVMGNMVDLNTTITNLMRAGIVGIGSLGAIGSMISGLSSTFAPSTMLSKLGINKGSTATKISNRGKGLTRRSKQVQEESSSTLVGNASGDDYYESSMTSANDQVDKTAEQKKQESTDISLNNIHEYLLSVFDPKITEIERLIALLAGYQTTTRAWGDFKNDDKETYKGTTVQVHYFGDLKGRADNSELIKSIQENTSNIYSLLERVVSGESSLTVKNETVQTNTLLGGLPGFNS